MAKWRKTTDAVSGAVVTDVLEHIGETDGDLRHGAFVPRSSRFFPKDDDWREAWDSAEGPLTGEVQP